MCIGQGRAFSDARSPEGEIRQEEGEGRGGHSDGVEKRAVDLDPSSQSIAAAACLTCTFRKISDGLLGAH